MSFFKRGIRLKVTLIALAGSLIASAAVVLLTAQVTEQVLEGAISDDLADHIDKAQEAVELGHFELAVQVAGSDIMQVIAADGEVLASSANARGLAAIVDLDDDDDIYEVSRKQLRESSEREKANAREVGQGDAAAASGVALEAPGQEAVGAVAQDVESREDGVAVARTGSKRGEFADKPSARDADAGKNRDKGVALARDDDGDDDDDDDDARGGHVGGSVHRDKGDDRDDDRDGDDADDDDNDDDNDDDDDDEDDDDDKDRAKTRGAPTPLLAPVAKAHAAQGSSADSAEGANSEKEPYIDASAVLGDEGPYLVMRRSVQSPNGRVTIAAMTSLAPALRTAEAAARPIAAIMAALLVLVGIFAWRLTGRTLRPVEEMRASVEAIGAGNLGDRVLVPAHDRDLAPLAETFNALLDRIEDTVNRQKRFISDASHELKSPVAATGVMLETMREYPDAVDVGQAVSDLTAENERMARIVGNMLVLARHDEGSTSVEAVPLDLMDVLMEEVAALSGRSAVSVDTSRVEPVTCRADRDLLSHAVRNLLDNAVRYANSSVRLSCRKADAVVSIVVSDDGPGIPEEDRERAFGRFVRLEDAQRRRKDSTGLGLSVVKSAVEQMSGTVRFTAPELGGATAVIEMPAQA